MDAASSKKNFLMCSLCDVFVSDVNELIQIEPLRMVEENGQDVEFARSDEFLGMVIAHIFMTSNHYGVVTVGNVQRVCNATRGYANVDYSQMTKINKLLLRLLKKKDDIIGMFKYDDLANSDHICVNLLKRCDSLSDLPPLPPIDKTQAVQVSQKLILKKEDLVELGSTEEPVIKKKGEKVKTSTKGSKKASTKGIKKEAYPKVSVSGSGNGPLPKVSFGNSKPLPHHDHNEL